MSATEKAIRDNFPGKSNAGLRAKLLEAAIRGKSAVNGLLNTVALTACGKAGLRAVVNTIDA